MEFIGDDELTHDKQYQIKQTIRVLKQNLIDTDYRAIKFIEGYYTEEQYAETKKQRQEWRDEINRLEASIEK